MATTLGEQALAPEPLVNKGLGSIVKFKVDGTAREFLVVDKSQDGGVKILLKTPFSLSKYCANGNSPSYFGEYLDIACNETFYNQIEEGIRNKILPSEVVQIPSTGQLTKQNRYCYAPSFTECVNMTHSYARVEGKTWEYFSDIESVKANTKRAFYDVPKYETSWLRSITFSSTYASSGWTCFDDGQLLSGYGVGSSFYVRPALTLPYNLIVDSDGNVTSEEAMITLADMPLGSSVKIGIYGSDYDFTVVNKDSSDVTLWMKGYYGTQVFGNNNTYAGSSIDTYANGTFYNLIDKVIRDQIINTTIKSNGTTIQRKVYLPSMTEIGGTHTYALTIEGPTWQYFSDTGGGTGSNTKRAYSGSFGHAWLRSRYTSNSGYSWNVDTGGYLGGSSCSGSFDFRPALNLPSSLNVKEDGTVTVNTPPTTPETINVPQTIYGGKTTTISWSASTDPDGNLEGYELERSTDGGSTWTNRYRGELTTTSGIVPYGTQSVMYRVRAYDTEGEYSAWRTSASVNVINNVPPTKIETLTLPTSIYGGKNAVITWSASTDPEGGELTYVLSRQEDSGEWEEVYNGANLTYTDSVKKTIDTIRWKVYAVDDKGDKSEDTISAIRTVLHNNPPEITSDPTDGTDVGEITEPFSITYSVADEDEDEVTVTERIDNRVMREHVVTLGNEYTFEITDSEFLKTLNGEHTATISALDKGEPVVSTIKFTKALYEATATLETPLDVDEPITVCAMSVEGYIPEDADYTVLVTNNALDDEPVWEDMTSQIKAGLNHPFTNTTVATTPAFNFKAIVKRGASGEGGYIDSISGAFE